MPRLLCCAMLVLLSCPVVALPVTFQMGDTPLDVTYKLYRNSTLVGFYNGERTLDLAPDTYTVYVNSMWESAAPVGSFTLSTDGNTTVLNSAPGMLGGAGMLRFVNTPITIDVGQYQGQWSTLVLNASGNRTFNIPLGTTGIQMFYGAGMTPPTWGTTVQACVWNVGADGTVTVNPTASLRNEAPYPVLPFQGGPGSLTFPQTIPLTINAPEALPGTLSIWHLSSDLPAGRSTQNFLPGMWTIMLTRGGNSFEIGSFDVPVDPPPGWSSNTFITVDDTTYTMNAMYVPEPATMALLTLGSLALLRRRK